MVVGIDPGVANTGFGVVRAAGGILELLDGGTILTSPDAPAESRLLRIHSSLRALLERHTADALALEQVFFNRNVASALAVGQARGVAMLAAAERSVPCFDYTPQAVKMAVCGSGSAQKDQVQRMVASLLALPRPPESEHAADALAVAICHAAAQRVPLEAVGA